MSSGLDLQKKEPSKDHSSYFQQHFSSPDSNMSLKKTYLAGFETFPCCHNNFWVVGEIGVSLLITLMRKKVQWFFPHKTQISDKRSCFVQNNSSQFFTLCKYLLPGLIKFSIKNNVSLLKPQNQPSFKKRQKLGGALSPLLTPKYVIKRVGLEKKR